MEERGLPKRNIVLAIGLSLLVYLLWFSFLPKKEHRQLQPAPTQQVAPIQTPLPVQDIHKADEVSFGNGEVSGKVLLDKSAPLSELLCLEPKRRILVPTLLAGSRFLATFVEAPTASSWKVTETRSKGLTLELPLGKKSSLIKELRVAANNGDSGTLKLFYASAENKPLEVLLEIGGRLSDAKNDDTQSFAGYIGPKGLIIQRQKGKQTSLVAELAPGKPIDALGFSSRYNFAAIFSLNANKPLSLERNPETKTWFCRLSLKPREPAEIPFYVGFKSDAVLKKLRLENLLYGGWLGPIERLVRVAMGFFYRLTGNYGLAIILLTLVFQAVLLPFTLKNLKLTQKMKDLAPRVKLIQEKYKNDPKKMQVEMMQLYRSQGANPLSGCLLMLPQMPIFIALYTSLNENYDLYGAPFMLWIKNLAQPDPTYILPLLMGAAMFVQTKFSSTGAIDPSQKMMSYIMPAVFTFMFLKFPSGLVLYWLTSNVVSLILSVVLPRLIDKGGA